MHSSAWNTSYLFLNIFYLYIIKSKCKRCKPTHALSLPLSQLHQTISMPLALLRPLGKVKHQLLVILLYCPQLNHSLALFRQHCKLSDTTSCVSQTSHHLPQRPPFHPSRPLGLLFNVYSRRHFIPLLLLITSHCFGLACIVSFLLSRLVAID